MTTIAILLGTAQDAGLPQAGCTCDNCRRAWDDPSLRRYAACLGLVDTTAGQCWLIDATPDFRQQLHALQQAAPGCSLAGILLTHAHVGHYTGLLHLGYECMNTHQLPLYASDSMAAVLRENLPWSQLVARQNVALHHLRPGEQLALSPDLQVTPYPVPHRDEHSDTLAFLVEGAQQQLFYCPDIDSWGDWALDVREFVAGVDVALLDASFYSAAELPGRDLSQIPHPLATDTAARLAGVDCDVRLIHLNHTNPLHHPGPEREWLMARGLAVGAFGDRWELG